MFFLQLKQLLRHFSFQGCNEDEFTCESSQRCIDLTRLCNQINDCLDGSDEKGCPCNDVTEWTCTDGTCVNKEEKCDGEFQVFIIFYQYQYIRCVNQI